MTPDEIWEECICDSLGDMNVFSEANAREYAAKMLPEIKKVVTETAKSPTQTRGSPEGKASEFRVRQEATKSNLVNIALTAQICPTKSSLM